MASAIPAEWHVLAEQTNRAYRLQSSHLAVDGVPFQVSKYPWIKELLNERVPEMTIIKGGQMGFTSTFVFDAALRAVEEDLRGILYLFPTEDDVYDFSRTRWSKNVNESEFFGQYCNSTDTAGLKRLKNTDIYFRACGAIGSSTKLSLSKLKSIPVDHLVEDESDEMQASRRDAAEKRLDGSKDAGHYPRIIRLSTPTIRGYGVDYDYRELSDCRVWEWQCDHCSAWTCLELTWPECIADPVGREPYYVCSHCKKALRRRKGRWTAAYPDRSDHHRGYWVSQLSKRAASDILRDLAAAEKRGRKREFYNQTLARAHAEVEDQLTKEMLDDCLTEEPRSFSAEGPTCAGADPGAHRIHYYVKERIGDRDSRTLSYGFCDSFDELAQISRKFNVQVGCIDQMAETHAVRRFVKDHNRWWGVKYVEQRKGTADWDPAAKTVVASRNEVLDASHYKFLEKRERLPAPDENYHELLVPQLCNMARIKHENEITGDIRYQWVVLGGRKNDHLKHCHGYATLAEERVALAHSVSRARRRTSYDRAPLVAAF